MIRPKAAIQLTIIELVIGKPNTRPISTAFCGRPRSAGSESPKGPVDLVTDFEIVEATSDCAPSAHKLAIGKMSRTINSNFFNFNGSIDIHFPNELTIRGYQAQGAVAGPRPPRQVSRSSSREFV